MKLPKVLYFSLNPFSVEQFYLYNKKNRACELLSFRLYPEADGKNEKCVNNFSHTSDLISFLDEEGKNNSLPKFVIIDYISLCNPKSKEKADSVTRSREIIRRAILKYPEINFLFDETRNKCEDKFCFLDFLFLQGYKKIKYDIIKEYHFFRASKNINEAYEMIVRGRDNLYDGSNLRYACRHYNHNVLKVNRYNFSLFQCSRRNSLALCVEEEHSQNRFNSYALYANGFRVLPVVTMSELGYFNTEFNKKYKKADLIVRDYDLQFPDAKGSDNSVMIDGKEFKINVVDCIRGIKFWDSEFYTGDSCPKEYANKWYIPQTSDNIYDFWTNLQDVPTLFVSKGVSGIKFCMTRTKLLKKLGKDKKQETTFQDKKETQYVRGIRKPVSGIYCPFQFFETIRNRYKSFEIKDLTGFVLRDAENIISNISNSDEKYKEFQEQTMNFFIDKYHLNIFHWSYWRLMFYLWKRWGYGVFKNKKFDKQIWMDELKNQSWVIDTSREKHDHGVPLDIYDLVQSMLSRAKHYYDIGKYIRAAIISSETIELLNGFHEALTLQAYHILAISENAIAMNAIGGSELALKEDTKFRINKIENEIERILNRTKSEGQTKAERRDLKYNILNQIFSNCREFCKGKEYFEAENCFISAMAHVNEGFASSDIWHELKAIFKRIKVSWELEKDSCQ